MGKIEKNSLRCPLFMRDARPIMSRRVRRKFNAMCVRSCSFLGRNMPIRRGYFGSPAFWVVIDVGLWLFVGKFAFWYKWKCFVLNVLKFVHYKSVIFLFKNYFSVGGYVFNDVLTSFGFTCYTLVLFIIRFCICKFEHNLYTISTNYMRNSLINLMYGLRMHKLRVIYIKKLI